MAAKTLKTLFIGNSFTARNNMPAMIAALAAACGCPFEWRLISVGGASLGRHWNGGAARAAIESGGYDFVVLQEQSTLPIKSARVMHDSVRLFDGVIQASGAATLLYMTWARRHAPQTQEALTQAYQAIGGEVGARIAPAGELWRRFRERRTEPDLYDKDGSHPSPAGSFLAACALAWTLIGHLPAEFGAPVGRVSAAEASELLSFADEALTSGV